MTDERNLNDTLSDLETSLAKQFRLLQTLVTVTKEERLSIPHNRADELMELVERKESVLDQLSLLEDHLRMLIHQLSQVLAIPAETSGLSAMLQQLPQPIAERLGRMNEGILCLAEEVRELNRSNQVLAQVGLEWARSTQAFLLNLIQPEPAYAPHGAVPLVEKSLLSDFEHRA